MNESNIALLSRPQENSESADTASSELEEDNSLGEQFFRRIANKTPSIIHIFDLDNKKKIFLNKPISSLLGFSLEEIRTLGNGVMWELIHPDDTTGFHEHLKRLRTLEDHEVAEFEFRLRDRNGKWRWFQNIDSVFTRNDQGKVCQFIGTAQEITERKKLEDRLSRSEALYRAIGESIDYGVWICAPDGSNTYASESFLKLVGITQEQCCEFGWGKVLHPDDAENTIDAWKDCVRTGGKWDREHRFKGVDGEWHPILARGVPIKDEKGKITCWAGINLDIGSIKQADEALHASEQRIRLATETTGVGVWEYNLLTNQVRWDEQMFRLYGLEPTANGIVTYETWRRTVLPEDLPPRLAQMQKVISSGEIGHCEFRIRRVSDGEVRTLRAVETIRKNANGQTEEVVGTNFDITEARRAENALKEADQRKDKFLATLAHELRNPLAPIRNGLQLLSIYDDKEKSAKIITMMEKQINQMVRLIDDLLDIARISQEKIILQKDRISIQSVIQFAIETNQPLIQEKNHKLILNIQEDKIWIEGDMIRLSQVIGNLINNAIKYTTQGGIITISVVSQKEEVVISITDNGIGIPADMMPKVFELFTQIGSSLERSQGGLGIGLALVKQLVEMHSGRVYAQSAGLNKGSIFTVHLPLAPIDIKKEILAENDPCELAASKKLRLLIVDDNIPSAQTLGWMVEFEGYEYRLAHNGFEAINIAKDMRPDIILLDIGLPDINGYDVCRQLREDQSFKDVIIIAQTGWGRELDRKIAYDAGFNHHLTKPMDSNKLLQLLKQHAG